MKRCLDMLLSHALQSRTISRWLLRHHTQTQPRRSRRSVLQSRRRPAQLLPVSLLDGPRLYPRLLYQGIYKAGLRTRPRRHASLSLLATGSPLAAFDVGSHKGPYNVTYSDKEGWRLFYWCGRILHIAWRFAFCFSHQL